MTEFIRNLVGNDTIATALMSFVPLIELKGAIVFARGAGFDFFMALLLSYIGSTLVFFPIFFLLRPILELMKKIKWFKTFATKVETYFQDKANSAVKDAEGKTKGKVRSESFLKQIGVFIFVAIPLPMTGIWTGTAIAVFLGLKFKEAVLPVCVGNLIAGILISVLAEVCLAIWQTTAVLDTILWILFGLALVFLVVVIVKVAISKPKQTEGNKDERN